MYGTIPDVVISKPPRNNQFRVVVALGVGVLIGALGTASMLFPVATKLTPAPTPAPPGPILESKIDNDSPEGILNECMSACHSRCENLYQQNRAHDHSRAAMELDAQSDGCTQENIDSITSCCDKAADALAMCEKLRYLPCFPGGCALEL